MKDDLGVLMKKYEKADCGGVVFSGERPILARLDGKAFHAWTKHMGLDRPFDTNLDNARRRSTLALMGESGAVVGHCQSDEISLVWHYPDPKSQPYMGGKLQKLVSVLASYLTVQFNAQFASGPYAIFDCRVWEVPTLDDAVQYVSWRQADAYRNAVTMAAQCHYSHSELLNKNTDTKLAMLAAKHITQADFPDRFWYGSLFVRETRVGKFSPDEIENLPPMHNARRNPDLEVTRSVITEKNFGNVLFLDSPVGALFNNWQDSPNRLGTKKGEVHYD